MGIWQSKVRLGDTVEFTDLPSYIPDDMKSMYILTEHIDVFKFLGFETLNVTFKEFKVRVKERILAIDKLKNSKVGGKGKGEDANKRAENAKATCGALHSEGTEEYKKCVQEQMNKQQLSAPFEQCDKVFEWLGGLVDSEITKEQIDEFVRDTNKENKEKNPPEKDIGAAAVIECVGFFNRKNSTKFVIKDEKVSNEKCKLVKEWAEQKADSNKKISNEDVSKFLNAHPDFSRAFLERCLKDKKTKTSELFTLEGTSYISICEAILNDAKKIASGISDDTRYKRLIKYQKSRPDKKLLLPKNPISEEDLVDGCTELSESVPQPASTYIQDKKILKMYIIRHPIHILNFLGISEPTVGGVVKLKRTLRTTPIRKQRKITKVDLSVKDRKGSKGGPADSSSGPAGSSSGLKGSKGGPAGSSSGPAGSSSGPTGPAGVPVIKYLDAIQKRLKFLVNKDELNKTKFGPSCKKMLDEIREIVNKGETQINQVKDYIENRSQFREFSPSEVIDDTKFIELCATSKEKVTNPTDTTDTTDTTEPISSAEKLIDKLIQEKFKWSDEDIQNLKSDKTPHNHGTIAKNTRSDNGFITGNFATEKENFEQFDILFTSGENYDCLIHAILGGVSGLFRDKLNLDQKNEFASYFRREWLVEKYTDKYKEDNPLSDEKKLEKVNNLKKQNSFLEDDDIILITQILEINILVFRRAEYDDEKFQIAKFKHNLDNTSHEDYYYMMFNVTQRHFETVYNRNKKSYTIPSDEAERLSALSEGKKLITVKYIKFDKSDNSTHFDEKEYYDRAENKDKKTFILTNGANERVDENGGGTTAAIQKINPDLFPHLDNKNIDKIAIYTPESGALEGIFNETFNNATQKVVTKDGATRPAGTVFFNESKDPNPSNDISTKVKGVYHIKGLDLNRLRAEYPEFETSPLYKRIVKEYYKQILINFSTRTEEVIHLAQIPGGLYGGTPVTGNYMVEAVNEFVNSKDATRSFQINIDGNQPPGAAERAAASAKAAQASAAAAQASAEAASAEAKKARAAPAVASAAASAAASAKAESAATAATAATTAAAEAAAAAAEAAEEAATAAAARPDEIEKAANSAERAAAAAARAAAAAVRAAAAAAAVRAAAAAPAAAGAAAAAPAAGEAAAKLEKLKKPMTSKKKGGKRRQTPRKRVKRRRTIKKKKI